MVVPWGQGGKSHPLEKLALANKHVYCPQVEILHEFVLVHTVACRKTGLFGSLWYKMGALWMGIMYL